jgi:hypothetical protein
LSALAHQLDGLSLSLYGGLMFPLCLSFRRGRFTLRFRLLGFVLASSLVRAADGDFMCGHLDDFDDTVTQCPGSCAKDCKPPRIHPAIVSSRFVRYRDDTPRVSSSECPGPANEIQQ